MDSQSVKRCDFGISRIGRPFIVGHRGASANYPENTVLSIEQAIADGADAVEFDIHPTLDNELIIIHDPSLDRTTTGNGMISDKKYFGDIEFLTTKQEPRCSIARFQDVFDLLLKPENSHVWAVIDIKVYLSPKVLITLNKILKSYDEDLSVFSKRIALGIWHPKFISYARTYLSDIPIVHIGVSLAIAEDYFSDVDGYNLRYIALSGYNGRKFIEEAHNKGKPVFVWTVNEENHAKNCHNWGIDAIMTDKTKFFVDFFKDFNENEQEYKGNELIRRKFLNVSKEKWYTSWSYFGLRLIFNLIARWKHYKFGNI
ncbi:PLC-like phosphodiesterase [Glomus cerebriforme]|uniref:PLC-like phosphodiesterase n=1 Tax=Glomus cerebriforme TaxID=658196 RepID=A0A397SV52_9GLOM|nr:PLC-like phosphodiesterase [Glomus cerebriforme]